MITARYEARETFEKMVSGELTFYVDAKILNKDMYTKKGDLLGINELNSNRSAVFEVSAVVEEEDFYIYALQPCRVDPHRRLTAAVYGETEGGSDGN